MPNQTIFGSNIMCKELIFQSHKAYDHPTSSSIKKFGVRLKFCFYKGQ